MDRPVKPVSQWATNVRWLIFAISVITSFLLYLHRYTYQLIRPSLISDYKFTDDKLGYIESAFYWPYALGQLPSGAICDMFGAHLFVGGGIIVWSLMLLAFALTGNIWLLGISRGLFGAAQSGTYPSLAKVTRVWFPAKNRTFIQGCVASFGGRFGAALCPFLFYGLLMTGMTWQWVLAVFAIVGVLFGVVFLIFFRSSPAEDSRVNEAERILIAEGQPPPKDAAAAPSIPLSRLAGSVTLWIFAVQQFCNAGADTIFVLHLPSYFKATLGLDMKKDPTQLAIFVSMPLLAGALGGLFAGYLNDWLIGRTGNRRWVRSGVAFAGNLIACGMILLVMRQVNPWAVAAGLMATKFFTDWTQPTCWGACTDIGGRYSATVVGLINMAGNLGAATMPLVFGFVLTMYTTTQIVNGEEVATRDYRPILMIGGLLFLISAACWLLVDCTKTVERSCLK